MATRKIENETNRSGNNNSSNNNNNKNSGSHTCFAIQSIFIGKAIDQLQSDVDDNAVLISGSDSDGKEYKSIKEMWSDQGIISGLSKDEKRRIWYSRAEDWYEENCPATVDGVLRGFATISDIDLQGSKEFLMELGKIHPTLVDWGSGAACECGAGIGRVTKGVLLDLQGVTQVDLVESSPRLLYESPEYIGEEGASKCRFYCSGIQDWTPPKGRYSLIWIQWVLCYLTDDDIIEFLKRCAEGLLGDGKGVIVLKENTCGEGAFVVDKVDASVCRSLPYWLKLIEAAGLRVIL